MIFLIDFHHDNLDDGTRCSTTTLCRSTTTALSINISDDCFLFFSFMFSSVRFSVCLSFTICYMSSSLLIFNRFDVPANVFISNIYTTFLFSSVSFVWTFHYLYFLGVSLSLSFSSHGCISQRKEDISRQRQQNFRGHRKQQKHTEKEFLFICYVHMKLYLLCLSIQENEKITRTL